MNQHSQPDTSTNAAEKQPGIWQRYWYAYGGWRAVARSRYFWFSVALTFLCFPFWSQPNWWEMPTGILPDLLGFTLGGMAILIGICEARVIKVLSGPDNSGKVSDLAVIVSTFAHFVIVQAFALLAAMLCKMLHVPLEGIPLVGDFFASHPDAAIAWGSLTRCIGWSVSFLLFMYSILLIFATTLELFRVSTLLGTIYSALDGEQAEVSATPSATARRGEDSGAF